MVLRAAATVGGYRPAHEDKASGIAFRLFSGSLQVLVSDALDIV